MARVAYTYMWVVTKAGAVIATYRDRASAQRHADQIGGEFHRSRY